MPTIVGILTFMSMINFILSSVEHEKKFYTLGANYIFILPDGTCNINSTTGSNSGYLAPPAQFFMGAKLFIGTHWMRNEGVLKHIGIGYVKMHGFHGNP